MFKARRDLNSWQSQQIARAMTVRVKAGVLALAVCAMVCADCVSRVIACPFCLGSQQLTLREKMDTQDSSLIVEWRSGEAGNLDRQVPATTTFEIVEVIRGEGAGGESLTIDRYQDGTAGERFLISGVKLEDVIQWDRALPLSTEGLAYINSLPPAEASSAERVRHALKHLESPDDMVATDAFSVIASSPYEDLAKLREELPRKQLRRWVFGKSPIKGQLGVYGMLLGICGDASDRQRLEELALESTGELRLGIAGVMGGYLLLAGPHGLDVFDRTFLMHADCSSSDRAAVMESLRFIWEYGDGCIDRPRLRQSVRQQLNMTDMPELSIADLARWEDWSVTDQLVARYENPPDKHVDRAIINFLIVASQVDEMNVSPEDAQSIAVARDFVERLQAEQPDIYKRAARLMNQR